MSFTNDAVFKINNENVSFKYNDNPSIVEISKIVDDITEGVVNDIIGYEPVLFNYFYTVSVLNRLTDIELPDQFEESAEFIKNARMDEVINRIILSKENQNNIILSANSKIDYIKQCNANRSKMDDFFDSLSFLAAQFGESFKDVDINDAFEKLCAVISDEKNVNAISKREKQIKDTETVSE